MKQQSNILLLLDAVEEGFHKKSWHGTNLRGSLRGLTPAAAAWRPSDQRHNIWEIVVHCAYWKYAVRRRILGAKRGSFPLEGSNWFRRPLEYSPNAWKHDLQLLQHEHQALCDAIATLSDSMLKKKPKGSKVTTQAILTGIAAHDVYHAGQIQLLKRLQESA